MMIVMRMMSTIRMMDMMRMMMRRRMRTRQYSTQYVPGLVGDIFLLITIPLTT